MQLERKSFAGDSDQKAEYLKYLCDIRKWDKNLYIDPDTTHIQGANSAFYHWVEKYLNEMEKIYFGGKWNYTVIGPSKGNEIPSGIKVCDETQTIMYLRTDQIGFSAPQGTDKDGRTWDDRYPYGKYIKLTNICDCKIIADIIWDTRSYGGFLVWPIKKFISKRITWKSQYNILRGVNSYIEDRIDITLWEIKEFYDNWNAEIKPNDKEFLMNIKNKIKESGLVLLSGNDSDLIIKWLAHFETFEKYVNFFAFESFIKRKTNEIHVINIINDHIITKDYIDDVRKNRNSRIVSLNKSDELIKLLNRLQNQTNCRTDEMIKRMKEKPLT